MRSTNVLSAVAIGIVVLSTTGYAVHTSRGRPVLQAPHFEVASVLPDETGKPVPGPSGCHGIDNTKISASLPLGRCVFSGITMTRLLMVAFPPPEPIATSNNVTDGTSQNIFADVSARSRIMPLDQWITNAPGWFNSSTFTINAKAENPESTTQDQLRLMLQTLLKERFKLAYHLEPKNVSAYFIVGTKDGIKLKEVPFQTTLSKEDLAKRRASSMAPFPIVYGSIIQLAILMTGRLKMPVIDTVNATTGDGVPSWYDFRVLDGVALDDSPAEAENTAGSIFSALPKLAGLKIESGKAPVKVFVIDHAEKPTDAGGMNQTLN